MLYANLCGILPMYKIYKSPKHRFSFVSFAPSGSPNLNPHLRNFLNCSNSIQWSFKWGREVVWVIVTTVCHIVGGNSGSEGERGDHGDGLCSAVSPGCRISCYLTTSALYLNHSGLLSGANPSLILTLRGDTDIHSVWAADEDCV